MSNNDDTGTKNSLNNKITRKEFGRRLATGIGGAALFNQWPSPAGSKGTPKEDNNRPNILFICADQHSYNCTGYGGHPFVKTPNLDRIASRGVAFSNTYVGSPLCTPSRACMMTGMFPSDCNSFGNYTVWDGSHPTWGTRLQNAGYHTWGTGKMELNPKHDIGFADGDYINPHYHNGDIMELFRRPVAYRVNERPLITGSAREKRDPRDVTTHDKAQHYLKNKAPGIDKPWAAFVSFKQIDLPYIALDKYFHYYYPNRVDMPNVPPQLVENLNLVYQQLRHYKRIATPISDERIRRARAGYYAEITELDEYVGQLWDELEKSGQLTNTIVIYTSDHGDAIGRHGLWGMNNLFEGATRVPLVMAGSGLPEGKVIDRPISHVDLIYTMLEWAGAQRPDALRGRSLTPLIQNNKSRDYPPHVYAESHSAGMSTGCFMIRKGDWKYMRNVWYDEQLYNLSEDPLEFTNLIEDPQTQSKQKELREILESLIDPEEITNRAFTVQQQALDNLVNSMSEKQLAARLTTVTGDHRRMGASQAKIMAHKLKNH